MEEEKKSLQQIACHWIILHKVGFVWVGGRLRFGLYVWPPYCITLMLCVCVCDWEMTGCTIVASTTLLNTPVVCKLRCHGNKLTNINRHTPVISKLAGWRVFSIWFIICCSVEINCLNAQKVRILILMTFSGNVVSAPRNKWVNVR